ncbi:MAG: hypothetical protein KAW47_05665 [Thermoplasmatales archaeon]|jgi:hypothetical protein|nr:hypothetical protein [Thermoplasmatales archaeon]
MANSILKTRLMVLWLFIAVAMSAHSVLAFMEEGVIEQIMSGEVEGMELSAGIFLFMAIFWLIPLWMAVLSVTLKDHTNRWANIILGALFVVLNLFHLAEHLMNPSAHQLLIIGSTVVVAILIVWYAWKWPKPEPK